MPNNKYTHTGWFYFLPIDLKFEGEGFEGAMRWTGWQWPVLFMGMLHNLICTIMITESYFPIKITGEYYDQR